MAMGGAEFKKISENRKTSFIKVCRHDAKVMLLALKVPKEPFWALEAFRRPEMKLALIDRFCTGVGWMILRSNFK